MRFIRLPAYCVALAFLVGFAVSGGEAPAAAIKPEDTNAQETLRSYVQLQEQLHAAQMQIEQARKENAEAAAAAQKQNAEAARNSEALAIRLGALENSLSAQRARELEAMQSSNRVMLIVAGTFAFVGVAAMLLMAFFQWRTVNGLAALSAGLPPVRLLAAGPAHAALGTGELAVGIPGKVEQSNARLIGALEQLEQRIYQLESATRPVSPEKPAASDAEVQGRGANGNGGTAESASSASDASAGPAAQSQARCKQLLGAGQEFLDQDKPERALACFDEALALNPRHGEALVKKGTALERLQKLDEAIACYDAAIEVDSSLTVAYLHKAGLFNRMEKFSQALQYYEKALSTQEKRSV